MRAIDQEFVAQLIAIARAASKAILAIYDAPVTCAVQLKSDDSPVTAADLEAHHIILQGLAQLLAIPVISEEAKVPAFAEREHWPCYWLVDPLDGTKEFIARNGEFTVNIALVQQGIPVLGVVHVPVTDESYLGLDKSIAADQLSRAEKYLHGKKIADLKTRNLGNRFADRQTLDVLASARHGGNEVAILLQQIAQQWPAPINTLSVGSSLKFCWIAEGRADFYARLAPTCEWDTAAAQAVLVAAGGLVVNADSLQALTYNKANSLINPFFLALGDASFNWNILLSRQG